MKPHLLATCAAVLAGLGMTAGRAAPAEPVIQWIGIQFATLDRAKAPASAVSVLVEDLHGLVAAKHDITRGLVLAPDSRSPELTVPITHGPVIAADLHDFRVVIELRAADGQNDTWRFNCIVQFHLANGVLIARQIGPCELQPGKGATATVAREFHGLR